MQFNKIGSNVENIIGTLPTFDPILLNCITPVLRVAFSLANAIPAIIEFISQFFGPFECFRKYQ